VHNLTFLIKTVWRPDILVLGLQAPAGPFESRACGVSPFHSVLLADSPPVRLRLPRKHCPIGLGFAIPPVFFPGSSFLPICEGRSAPKGNTRLP